MAKYAVFASFSLLLRSVLLFLRQMAYSLLTLVVLDFSTRNLVCSYLYSARQFVPDLFRILTFSKNTQL